MDLERVKEALARYLGWLEGFEESTLYEDYRESVGFTNEEWDDTLSVLEAFARSPEKELSKERR